MANVIGRLKIDDKNEVYYQSMSDAETNKLKEFYFYAITQFVIRKNVKDITREDAIFIYDALSFMNEVAVCSSMGVSLEKCPPIKTGQLIIKPLEVAIALTEDNILTFVAEDKTIEPMHMLVVIGAMMGCTLDILDRTDVFEQLVETGFMNAYKNSENS